MSRKYVVLIGFLCVAAGSAGGFFTEKWLADTRAAAVEKFRERRDQEDLASRDRYDAAQQQAIQQLRGTVQGLSAAESSCQQNFISGTVLYETPPSTAVAMGVRQLFGSPFNITPGSNVAPRWWIPARIKPQSYGGDPAAVYYYIGQDNKVDGPYLPSIVGR